MRPVAGLAEWMKARVYSVRSACTVVETTEGLGGPGWWPPFRRRWLRRWPSAWLGSRRAKTELGRRRVWSSRQARRHAGVGAGAGQEAQTHAPHARARGKAQSVRPAGSREKGLRSAAAKDALQRRSNAATQRVSAGNRNFMRSPEPPHAMRRGRVGGDDGGDDRVQVGEGWPKTTALILACLTPSIPHHCPSQLSTVQSQQSRPPRCRSSKSTLPPRP